MKTLHKLLLTTILVMMTSGLFAVVTTAKPTVGVPLDGGLLTILAGAGLAYFAARKRKKNSEA